MIILRMRTWVGLAAAALLLATVAVAQPELPRENHYAVYYSEPYPTIAKPLKLTDQFGVHFPDPVMAMERWSNPAEKVHLDTGDHFPIIDPIIHQTWWKIYFPGTTREVIGIDQFGTRKWRLGNPDYLLVPALKNVPPPGEPPIWNHYLCYQNQLDESLLKAVLIIDQFGNWQVSTLYPKWFCTPVEKEHLDDGRIYPIMDHKAHLACYLYANLNLMSQYITGIDQFGNWELRVTYEHCLCVPALKELPVRTEESTWGKIKALYN